MNSSGDNPRGCTGLPERELVDFLSPRGASAVSSGRGSDEGSSAGSSPASARSTALSSVRPMGSSIGLSTVCVSGLSTERNSLITRSASTSGSRSPRRACSITRAAMSSRSAHPLSGSQAPCRRRRRPTPCRRSRPARTAGSRSSFRNTILFMVNSCHKPRICADFSIATASEHDADVAAMPRCRHIVTAARGARQAWRKRKGQPSVLARAAVRILERRTAQVPGQAALAAPAALARDRRKHRQHEIDRDQAEQQVDRRICTRQARPRRTAQQAEFRKTRRLSGMGNDNMAPMLCDFRHTMQPSARSTSPLGRAFPSSAAFSLTLRQRMG